MAKVAKPRSRRNNRGPISAPGTTAAPPASGIAVGGVGDFEKRLRKPLAAAGPTDFDIRTISPALRLVKLSVIAKELGIDDRGAEALLRVLGVPTLDVGHGPEISAFSLDLALFGLLLPGNRSIRLDESLHESYDAVERRWSEVVADKVALSALMSVASLYYTEAVARTLRDRLQRVAGLMVRTPTGAGDTIAARTRGPVGRPRRWVRVAPDLWNRLMAHPALRELEAEDADRRTKANPERPH